MARYCLKCDYDFEDNIDGYHLFNENCFIHNHLGNIPSRCATYKLTSQPFIEDLIIRLQKIESGEILLN